MKKYISIVIFVLVLFGCEKNVIGDFGGEAANPENNDPDSYGLTEEAKLKKKGVAFTNGGKNWSHKTSELKAHWMYSWGNTLRDEIPENVEFVPMFWGKGSVNSDNLAKVKQYIDEGKVKYVLGFNEPDGANQANMTVDEAIALWPQLETLGVPLGSPATVNPNNEWMVEFMQKVKALNLRVDFVTVHNYGGISASGFINLLETTFLAYDNRPIWITEFAVADWTATTPAENKYSQSQVMNFMSEVLPQLDALDWIHRYVWFDGGQRNGPLYSSSLYDQDGNITPVGQLYAGHKSNLEIGPGVDTDIILPNDPNNLIVNPSFEDGITPWIGFKNGTVLTSPHSGNRCGRIEHNDGSLVQVVTVEPLKTYVLKFWSRWVENITNSFSPQLRNNDVSGAEGLLFTLNPVPQSDQWEETTYEFTVPEGVTQLRIQIYKHQTDPVFPQFFLDDVSLKEKI